MLPTYPKGLASSQDASELSLTVASFIKVLLYGVTFYAVKSGLDPITAQSQVQGLIDVALLAVPAVMTLYHSVQTAWGLIRKMLSFFKKPATVMTPDGPVEVQSVTPIVTVEPVN